MSLENVAGIYIDDDNVIGNLNFVEQVKQIEIASTTSNETQPFFVANAMTVQQPVSTAAADDDENGEVDNETTTLWCYVCNDFENVSTASVPSVIIAPPLPPPPPIKVEKGNLHTSSSIVPNKIALFHYFFRLAIIKCETCQKTFKKLSLLQRHMVVHTKEKQFSCPVCNKMFVQKASLSVHMM